MTTKYELRVTGEFKQNLKLCQKRGLLVHHEIDGVKTHEGVRQQFGLHCVLKNIVSREWGRFYTIMFNSRSAADYEDFKDFDLLTVKEQYPKVREFINMIDTLVFPQRG